MSEELRFSFGRNWQDYLAGAGEREIAGAEEALARLLPGYSLAGRSFLDIGCGSGLMSLAALRLGAARVAGIDCDPDSVAASESLRARFPDAAGRWTIRQGSVLDQALIGGLGRFDVIYSWGVLHHTGDMWTAFENVASLTAPDGRLAIAIYNRTFSAPFWHRFKRFYNRSGEPVRTGLTCFVFLPRAAVRLLRGRHPLRDQRGMNVWYDARDWAGGFPYEYASVEEVTGFFAARGFTRDYVKPTRLSGCNEFTFRKL